jgi:hypothetical protein
MISLHQLGMACAGSARCAVVAASAKRIVQIVVRMYLVVGSFPV